MALFIVIRRSLEGGLENYQRFHIFLFWDIRTMFDLLGSMDEREEHRLGARRK